MQFSKRMVKPLAFCVAMVMAPSWLAMVSLRSRANPPRPMTGIITYPAPNAAQDLRVRIHSGALLGTPLETAITADTVLQRIKDSLLVVRQGATAHVLLRDANETAIGTPIVAGPEAAGYRFPCTGLGQVTLGLAREDGGCIEHTGEFRVGSMDSPTIGKVPRTNATASTFPLVISQSTKQLPDFIQDLFLDQIYVQYCGAATDTGGGQTFRFADSLGLTSSEDPCQRAVQACFEETSDASCSLIRAGEWYGREQELSVQVDCQGIPVNSFRGTGAALAATVLTSAVDSCSYQVYRPEEIVISPVGDDMALIQTQEVGPNLQVSVLSGSVNIRSIDNMDGQEVDSWQKYIHSQGQGELNSRVVNIDTGEQTRLMNSPGVQAFLDTNHWPPGAISQIRDYQTALRESAIPETEPLELTAISLSPSRIQAGDSLRGTVSLSRPAPSGGVQVSLSSNNSNIVEIPTSVFIQAGETEAVFSVTTNTVFGASEQVITIFASAVNSRQSTTLTVVEQGPF